MRTVLKEINPGYSLAELMLKLILQYFSHPRWSADSLEKSLFLAKTESRRSRGMRWLDSITDAMDVNLGNLQEMVRDREAWCAAAREFTKSPTLLGNWTTATRIDRHIPTKQYAQSNRLANRNRLTDKDRLTVRADNETGMVDRYKGQANWQPARNIPQWELAE